MKVLIIYALTIIALRIDCYSQSKTPGVNQQGRRDKVALITLLEELSKKEKHPLLKLHFESVAAVVGMTADSALKERDWKLIGGMLASFKSNDRYAASRWESYASRKRPLVISFLSPSDGKRSFFRITLPEDPDWSPAKEYPLFMELHGMGFNENTHNNPLQFRLFPQYLQPEVSEPSPIHKAGYHLYPWGRGDRRYSNANGNNAENDLLEVLAVVDSLFKTDPQRQYLFGFSMGASGTWTFGTRHPERWTAMAPYACFEEGTSEEIAAWGEKPIYFVVGLEDKRSLARMDSLYQKLNVAGNPPEYFVKIRSTPHRYLSYYIRQVYEWFLTKTKSYEVIDGQNMDVNNF